MNTNLFIILFYGFSILFAVVVGVSLRLKKKRKQERSAKDERQISEQSHEKDFSAPTNNSGGYYYPESDCDLYDLVKNFGDAGVISVRFDGVSAPVKVRAFLSYGETIEEETYVFCELAFHYEIPLEKRCVSLKIVRDKSGKTLFRTVGATTDDAMQKRISADIEAILSDKEEGAFLIGELDGGVKYGVDLRMNDKRSRYSFEMDREANEGSGQAKIRSNARSDSKPLIVKSEQWFKSNGVRLAITPIKKRDIRNMSADERRLISFTTFPYVFKSLIFVSVFVGLVLLAALIAFLIGLSTDGAGRGGIYLAAVLMISLFGGSFIINPPRRKTDGSFILNPSARILDGFDELSGKWALKLPIGYKIWLFIITPIALLWGIFSTFIFSIIGKDNEAKARSLALVVVPEGYGFDDMVELYAAYEVWCVERDKNNAKLNKAESIHKEGLDIYEKGIKKVENDPTKNYIEKAEEKAKLDNAKKKVDDEYEKVKNKIYDNNKELDETLENIKNKHE